MTASWKLGWHGVNVYRTPEACAHPASTRASVTATAFTASAPCRSLAMPTATPPMPAQESSQVRSAWSTRSYEGRGSRARRGLPAGVGRVGRARLLDHLVCPDQRRLRTGETERLRCLEVDD